ncbi:MAG: hypothetical protein PVI40_05895 [Chlamydiota bacterium]|jgi:hypothetical protein
MLKKALLTLCAFSFLAAFNGYADECDKDVAKNDEPTTVEQPATPDGEE